MSSSITCEDRHLAAREFEDPEVVWPGGCDVGDREKFEMVISAQCPFWHACGSQNDEELAGAWWDCQGHVALLPGRTIVGSFGVPGVAK